MPLKIDTPNAPPLKRSDHHVPLKINSHNEWDKLFEIILVNAFLYSKENYTSRLNFLVWLCYWC